MLYPDASKVNFGNRDFFPDLESKSARNIRLFLNSLSTKASVKYNFAYS